MYKYAREAEKDVWGRAEIETMVEVYNEKGRDAEGGIIGSQKNIVRSGRDSKLGRGIMRNN